MAEIAIIVPAADVAEVESVLRGGNIEAATAAGHGFDGADVVSLIVTLTPAAACLLATLYTTRQKAKRYTVFRYKGLEIKGVSEAELTKLAEKAMKDIVKKHR
jgi:hypothetical protein